MNNIYTELIKRFIYYIVVVNFKKYIQQDISFNESSINYIQRNAIFLNNCVKKNYWVSYTIILFSKNMYLNSFI